VTAPPERLRSASLPIGVSRSPAALPAERAVRLRWLSPAGASLTALARPHTAFPFADLWPALRTDPGAVLLLLRAVSDQPAIILSLRDAADLPPFDDTFLLDSAPLELALELLTGGTEPCFVDWSAPAYRSIYQTSLTLASRAQSLASRLSQNCNPERAWVCGLLAPLGWLLMTAVAPEKTDGALRDPELAVDSSGVQNRHWGLDHGAIVRQVSRHWRLPAWLTGVIANLGLPTHQARAFGADAVLLAVIRQAIRSLHGTPLALPGCHAALAAEDDKIIGSFEIDYPTTSMEIVSKWQNPSEIALLTDLLTVAIESRQGGSASLARRLSWEVDELHRGLETQVRGEHERTQTARLTALAEFSAGAGHEINNPLAVISGQAQYLLNHAEWLQDGIEGKAGQALGVIIAQTRRIHGILRDLMQFARPASPRPTAFELPSLLGQVACSLGGLAEARQVRVEVRSPDRLSLTADMEQLRIALTCLLQNAIEAAGGSPDAWARFVLPTPLPGGAVRVLVEDSGPGPSATQRPQLFDPFFSGRSAGRGRGLGLPIAWRMVRLQGGSVCCEPARPGEPTRFVLTLPTAQETTGVLEAA
jgi:two-component system, NtrC family, sensor kinase